MITAYRHHRRRAKHHRDCAAIARANGRDISEREHLAAAEVQDDDARNLILQAFSIAGIAFVVVSALYYWI
jgi:hypothetical protein